VRTESDLAKISISRSAERKPVMARAGLAEEICALILEPIGAGA
jgi:hypothetical protein